MCRASKIANYVVGGQMSCIIFLFVVYKDHNLVKYTYLTYNSTFIDIIIYDILRCKGMYLCVKYDLSRMFALMK